MQQPDKMKLIVLAEDDSDDQDMVREIVNEIDQEVDLLIFSDGEQLLTSMKTLSASKRPGLIILDQNMPKLKGSETITHIKAICGFENIPLVIYTTYHDKVFAERCKQMNVELFRKPDTFDAFTKMIGDLMKKYV
ncbi:MAG TPA: response regulator [Cyclobacteriaceae bacterium]|nr:response regulator [Cyclobacteriaceae bacterium]